MRRTDSRVGRGCALARASTTLSYFGNGTKSTRALGVSAITATFVNGCTSTAYWGTPEAEIVRASSAVGSMGGSGSTARILWPSRSATVMVWLAVFVLTSVLV